MKRAIALFLSLLLLLSATALAEETSMEFTDETGVESVDEIVAEPMDEISAEPVEEIITEAVEQDIDAVSMDLEDADEQSALFPEFSAVDETASEPVQDDVSDGNEDDAEDMPMADDAPDADESDAGEAAAHNGTPDAEEPSAPAEPMAASLEPETEQVSAAAMLDGPTILGTITNDCIAAIDPVTYNGEAQTPDVIVTVNGNVLIPGADYSVAYENNVNAGDAIVTVTGIGSYVGSTARTFTINKVEKTVTARYTGDVPNKEYDKSRNLPVGFTFKNSDFVYDGKADGDTISIDLEKKDESGIRLFTAGYDGADIGSHKLTFKLAITYRSTNYIYKLASDTITSEKSGNITPKKLTIRPGVKKKDANGNLVKDSNGKIVVETQTKVYGTADPSSYSGVVDGIMEGDGETTDASGKKVSILNKIVTGKLARAKGENVGKYKLSIGTIKVRDDTTEAKNYLNNPPKLEEGYFEIVAKSIADLKLDTIPDQQYTGSAVTPDKAISLKYESKALGTKTLVKGTDFDVQYSSNVEPGKVTVTIIGKGNYTGTRTTYFNIKKTSSSSTTSTSLVSSNVGISSPGNQKYTGSAIEPEIIVTYTNEENGNTITETLVKGKDYDVLFDNNTEPGIATITVVGKGRFTGQRSSFFLIEKEDTTASAPAPAPADPAPATSAITATSNTKTSVSAAPGSVYQLDLGGQTGTKFKSSNSKVATVDQSGNVTFKKSGKVKITFKVGKKKRTVTLKVTDPTIPASVSLAPVNTDVKKGDTVTLSPSVPDSANPGGYKWKSSNKKVATVNNGVVTFKKPGKVTITCTAKRGKKKARVKFKVSK